MASRTPTVCNQCGQSGCQRHRRSYDKSRGSSAARGYDAAWRSLRLVVLAEEPLCRFCAEHGRTTAATDVDHIATIRERPDLRLVRSNLRSLCHSCHSRHTNSKAA